MLDVALAEDTECIIMGLQGLAENPFNALDVLKPAPQSRLAGIRTRRGEPRRVSLTSG